MKKVAFLICSNTVGGHEFQSVELVKLANKYCQSTVFLNNVNQINLFEGRDIEYFITNKPFFRNGNFLMQFFYGLALGFKLRKRLRNYDKIIVCAGTLEAGISAGFGLWGCDISLYVPMFVDRIALWGKFGLLYNLLSKLFTVFYKRIITINRFQGRVFYKRKPVFIIPNYVQFNSPINTNHIEYKRLYFVGRLEDKQKRIIELIKWLDVPENKFSEFIIVGDGPERENVIDLAQRAKHISIVFKGWLDNSDQDLLFTSKDVLVLNSAFEGEPLVVAEANNRGSIVLARNILGVRSCTVKKNRFNNKEELLNLLELAYTGKLDRFKNISCCQIERIRDNAAKEIFI